MIGELVQNQSSLHSLLFLVFLETLVLDLGLLLFFTANALTDRNRTASPHSGLLVL